MTDNGGVLADQLSRVWGGVGSVSCRGGRGEVPLQPALLQLHGDSWESAKGRGTGGGDAV